MRKLQQPEERKSAKTYRNKEAELGEFKELMRNSINMQFGAGLAEHNRSISGHRSSGNPITPKEV